MHDTEPKVRFDVYRAVTDSIITAIEAGAGKYAMPWHGDGAAITKPENAHTKMEYHGINILALWAAACGSGYQSGYWASYKQWQQVGGQVRKGDQGATVVFFKRLVNQEGAQAEADGPARAYMVARASRVFNAEQVAGWQPPAPRNFGSKVEVLASVAAFAKASGAEINHGPGGAYYDVVRDCIQLPEPARFTGSSTSTPSEAYHATLLHELVHWTGAAPRLDRKLLELSLSDRAREELVAELGAAFLCADLGVTNVPRPDHAAYVAEWLQALKNDTRAVFAAARLAGSAASYLHETVAKRG